MIHVEIYECNSAKMFGVFRVKNHDFTPKNHIFSNCGGRRKNFWGISCKKSRFYAKKSYFFPILGGRAPGAPPPPWIHSRAFGEVHVAHVFSFVCCGIWFICFRSVSCGQYCLCLWISILDYHYCFL